jgi:hypothetical protein
MFSVTATTDHGVAIQQAVIRGGLINEWRMTMAKVYLVVDGDSLLFSRGGLLHPISHL